MKYIIAIILTIFLSASMVHGDPKNIGLDVLGLAKQNTSELIDALEPNTAIGALQGTFGDIRKPLRKVLRSGKVHMVRIHLVNGPCRRNNRCESGEPSPKDFVKMIERTQQIEKFMQNFPNIKCYISPVLEHDEKDKAVVKRWFKIIDNHAPSCKKVCNAHTGYCPDEKGILIEKHGNNPSDVNVVSNDGASIFQSNSIEYRKKGKLVNFAWYPEMNLLYEGIENAWIVPSKRTCQSTKDLYRQAIRLLQTPDIYDGSTPYQCKRIVGFENRELLKTNAESYCNADKRGNRPLLILNKKYDKDLDILDPKGNKIGCAKYYGMYEDKQYRYYVGSCSGETPVQLMVEAKQERIYYLTSDGTCYKANAIRRQGYYK